MRLEDVTTLIIHTLGARMFLNGAPDRNGPIRGT